MSKTTISLSKLGLEKLIKTKLDFSKTAIEMVYAYFSQRDNVALQQCIFALLAQSAEVL
ncbi:hypothetical protein CI610_02792 [invertebrate metagenome]|uniref:Uncharacterized protein n=1 Tax=invertebrate metagenome TaxID=1711999 RepID=A0A2H9T4Y2_9ZZZZ